MQIDINKCLQDKCHQVCRMACPKKAININEQGQYFIDQSRCDRCKTCKIVCTYKAIED